MRDGPHMDVRPHPPEAAIMSESHPARRYVVKEIIRSRGDGAAPERFYEVWIAQADPAAIDGERETRTEHRFSNARAADAWVAAQPGAGS